MTNNKVIIITGSKGEGKTTKLQSLIKLLLKKNIPITGFIAPASFVDGERNTYNLKGIGSEETITLCSSISQIGYEKIGSFYFNNPAIILGNQILKSASRNNKIIVIDEIGPFELKGKVWYNSMLSAMKQDGKVIIITVREILVEEIVVKFNIDNYSVFSTNDDNQDIINEIDTFLINEINSI